MVVQLAPLPSTRGDDQDSRTDDQKEGNNVVMIRETESLNKIEINNCVGWGVLTTNVGIICGPVSSGVVTGNVENSAKKCLFTKKGLCQEHQVPGKKLNIPSEVETGKKFRIC